MHTRIQRSVGQTLVETMIALSVLVVGLMSLIGLLSRSFAISNIVSDNYAATYLAAEGIEVVKSLIDHNIAVGTSTAWNAGLGGCHPGLCEVEWNSLSMSSESGRKLSLDVDTGLYSYQPGVRTRFTRTIAIELIDSDHIKVNSLVTWVGSGGVTGIPIQSEVNIEDHFFNPY